MITHDNIVTEAKAMLRIQDTTDHDAMLKLFVNRGVRRMNVPDGLIIKNKVIAIEDLRAKLPDDFVHLIAFRFTDCAVGVYFEQPYIDQCTDCNNAYPAYQTGQIVGGYLMFNSEVSSDEVQIAYEALNVDDDGYMVINDTYREALVYFVCSEFAVSYPERYTSLQVEKWSTNFGFEAAKVRGQQQRRRFVRNKEYVKAVMNAILYDRSSVFNMGSGTRGGSYYTFNIA